VETSIKRYFASVLRVSPQIEPLILKQAILREFALLRFIQGENNSVHALFVVERFFAARSMRPAAMIGHERRLIFLKHALCARTLHAPPQIGPLMLNLAILDAFVSPRVICDERTCAHALSVVERLFAPRLRRTAVMRERKRYTFLKRVSKTG
jgi:hypothetical protein